MIPSCEAGRCVPTGGSYYRGNDNSPGEPELLKWIAQLGHVRRYSTRFRADVNRFESQLRSLSTATACATFATAFPIVNGSC